MVDWCNVRGENSICHENGRRKVTHNKTRSPSNADWRGSAERDVVRVCVGVRVCVFTTRSTVNGGDDVCDDDRPRPSGSLPPPPRHRRRIHGKSRTRAIDVATLYYYRYNNIFKVKICREHHKTNTLISSPSPLLLQKYCASCMFVCVCVLH